MGKISNSFIESVASLDIWEQQDVCIAYNRRRDAFDGSALGIASRLNVHWSIYANIAVSALGGILLNILIRQRNGEFLAYLLGAMSKSHAWFITTSNAAPSLCDVCGNGIQLLGSREGNDGSIREEQQSVHARNLCNSYMCKHATFNQYAMFFVEHGTQQIVGV